MSPYFLQDGNGEALLGFDDVLDGKDALDRSEPGTELVRACDGIVLGRRDKRNSTIHPTPHRGHRDH